MSCSEYSQKGTCPTCVVQKIKARRTRSVNTKITAISTERDLFV
jgi:hypothetical protein